MARLLMRAWREVTDDVQAGAAKFDGRWAQRGNNGIAFRLAERLHFKPVLLERGDGPQRQPGG